MAEFIGSTISLISKRDIRYVGTLHKIDSESSTVALEKVKSYGTEDRRTGDEEVAPSDKVYAFIVFRGSDVKDLRIENSAPGRENEPPQVPDDPAIIGNSQGPDNSYPPQPQSNPAVPFATKPQEHSQGQSFPPDGPQSQRAQPPYYQQQQQHPYYPPYGPPPGQGFRPQGYPPGPGFHHMPFSGPPPGWHPPPGQGYRPSGPPAYYDPQMQGPPMHNRSGPHGPIHPPAPGPMAAGKPNAGEQQEDKPTATVKLPSANPTPVPPVINQPAPPPPTESKPDISAALAPPAPSDPAVVPKGIPTMNGRIQPAIPKISPAVKSAIPVQAPVQVQKSATSAAPAAGAISQTVGTAVAPPKPVAPKSAEDANKDAIAAVAAAMAKLSGPSSALSAPPTAGEPSSGMDNLTKKVNEMRNQDRIRTSNQQGPDGQALSNRGGRGGRGGHRGGRRGNHDGSTNDRKQSTDPLPKDDYDFVTANAKFNKQDLVKEAIASGSPIGSPVEAPNGANGSGPLESALDGENPAASRSRKTSDAVAAPPSYNKASSFFDTLSSDVTPEREESRAGTGGARSNLRGKEFRNEERKLNLETFGQGSVDAGYGRGGYHRGRGRGRGGYRGRGGGYRGRGAPRGGTVASEAPA